MVSAADSFFLNFFHERIVYYCPTVIAVSGASLLLMCCAHASTEGREEHMLQAIFDSFRLCLIDGIAVAGHQAMPVVYSKYILVSGIA